MTVSYNPFDPDQVDDDRTSSRSCGTRPPSSS